ncbi:hypothetical protein GUA46_03695 [Muricauda sp. HICW]|uniref:Uncharacterized protein n=1 Tax=Flagellimonas chongwuensis TaxID=2697365 RepID=A0A850NBW3_9FLAO|nr:hypothetical protein [Allomuricauda chongwuensis]NVN17434.1 hypothetical protein [Allomuricauda chongwuensis]
MTRKISIIFIFFLSIKIYSQKCKTEQDPFTNEKITSFDFNDKTVYLEIKNDTITFDITFNYWGERDYEFEKKTEVSFKLENGSTIVLTTIKKSEPKIENVTSSNGFYQGFGGIMTTSSSKNFTAYSFVFLLTESELKKFADSKIELVRIPDTDEGEYVDLKAKGRTKKKIKAIIKGANCIIEQL